MPAATAVTTPSEDTVATVASDVLHANATSGRGVPLESRAVADSWTVPPGTIGPDDGLRASEATVGGCPTGIAVTGAGVGGTRSSRKPNHQPAAPSSRMPMAASAHSATLGRRAPRLPLAAPTLPARGADPGPPALPPNGAGLMGVLMLARI